MMRSILFDTNVVLDVLLDRDPWTETAQALWKAHLQNRIDAHVTATTLTDVFYVSRRQAGMEKAWLAVRVCLDQLRVIDVTIAQLETAAMMPGSDFEDNLQVACAAAARLEAIVTRDPKGLSNSLVPAITPEQALAELSG